MCYNIFNMAIKIIKKENGISIELNNGHLEALDNIRKKYNIKNEEETLSFILAVSEKTDGQGFHIGEKIYTPSKEIRE